MSRWLSLLKDHIDLARVPFSDRGSRILVYQQPAHSRLLVKLAERLIRIDPDIEAYLRRPPFIEDLVFIDATGDALPFSVETYPHRIHFHTSRGVVGLVFRDAYTLAFGLPSGQILGLRFRVRPEYWVETERGGKIRSVRDVDYHTNGEILRNEVLHDRDGFLIELLVQAGEDSTVQLSINPGYGEQADVLPYSATAAAAEAKWSVWFEPIPPVDGRYQRPYAYAWWVMAHNLVTPQGLIRYEAMMPSKSKYVGVWQWDSALHSLAYRHVDPELARDQIRVFLDQQFPDGMLPDAIFDEGLVSFIDHPFPGQVTKPPIMAWAALKIHLIAPDIGFLREIYHPLVRLCAWWFVANDDDGDGLVQYNHPYSSGLDDSPLWDYGMPVESPDINTYLCVELRSLARIASILQLPAEARRWRQRASALLERMIADLWDDSAGLFQAVHEERPVPVVTPFSLYPLWAGPLPKNIRDRLLSHLTDPHEFWGPLPIPTVARTDPHYDPARMWRGPVWANINYFFIEALQRIGEPGLARELRAHTLDMIAAQPGIVEYYHAETGAPAARAAVTYGWTAATFIDLAIQASKAVSATP